MDSMLHKKTFFCEGCNNEVDILRWKKISSRINGPSFRCDNCWIIFDDHLENEIKKKLIF